MHYPGVLIISAPSGAGKTSLARKLVEKRADTTIAVSHTTRRKRPGERDGVDYYFVDADEFTEMVDNDQFLEHATVFDHRYGTSVAAVEKLVDDGRYAILDIDWQGARNVRRKFPGACSVFVMPPSLEVLEQRLRGRKQDSDEVIARRMRGAMDEMSHKDEFDHILVNDDFDLALEQLETILLGIGNPGRKSVD